MTSSVEVSALQSKRVSPQGARLLRMGALTVGVWTLVGLLTTELAVLAIERGGGVVSWRSLLAANLVSVWLWAAFTPAMAAMARRFPPGESDWHRWIVPHLLGAVAFGAADVIFERAIWAVVASPPASGDLITLFLRRLFPNSLCYIVIVAITSVVRYSRISREREAATTRLASQLTAARLQMLQAQLRPHFLFNTLSMIAEQVHSDPDGADHMIGRLGHILRASLTSTDRHEVTLAEELSILEAYLDIMAVRLSGRAGFDIDVESECLDAAVPTLLLQPLVENAYRHGIERVARSGFVRIKARRNGHVLEIEIEDNGVGFDPQRVNEGVGLRIVRSRLSELYGRDGSMHLRPRASGGTISAVRLPFKRLTIASEKAHEPVVSFSHGLVE